MENFKRSVKRLVTRLTVLGLVVVCGAIAIAQANKDRTTAVAAAPDLTEAGTAFTDANQNQDRATGLQVPDMSSANASSSVAWGSDTANATTSNPPATNAQTPAQTPQHFVNDPGVVQAQAVQETPGRFDAPFTPGTAGAEPTEPVRRSRFSNDAAATSAPADVPDLAAGDFPIPPDFNNAPAPPGDTALPNSTASEVAPGAPAGFAQPDFGSSRFDEAGPAQPAAADVPSTVAADATFPAPRFSAEPRPSGNPVRPESNTSQFNNSTATRSAAPPAYPSENSFDPSVSQPAPRFGQDAPAAAPPAFDDPAPIESSMTPAANTFPAADNYAATSAVTLSGTGKPGARELEGMQSPSLSLQKIAPTNARVGEPATFRLKVRNNGRVAAQRVMIHDEVPQGTQLIDTNPQSTTDSQGGVLWDLGSLMPGQEIEVSMQVMPMEEGLIGSVGTVTFEAQASARTEVTKPLLKIEHSAKDRILIGDRVNFSITISNPGSGSAQNVWIEEDVPAGLSHSKGPKLEYELGTIPAGGQRRLELSLTAAEAGMVENIIRARADGGLIAEHKLDLEVIAPQLKVKIDGPKARYLERKATYSVAIENPGSADARNVELITRLPQGLKFVSTNNSGRFDAASNTIRWSLDRLPARQFGEVKFTAVPIQKGTFNINAEARAMNGLRDAVDHALAVDGIAALLFEVADQVDPIEIGGTTTYQIRVENQGTKEASNVQILAMIPEGMRAVPSQGRNRYTINQNRVEFERIARLPPKSETVFNIQVEGVAAGDQRFKAQVSSDDTASVVEEESTRVYAD